MAVINYHLPQNAVELKTLFECFKYKYPSLKCRKYYRGHSNTNYKLLTRIAEHYKDKSDFKKFASLILEEFKQEVKKAKILNKIYQPDNHGKYGREYFWYFQAQHLGIPTPFLDWTSEWEKALFFCCSEEKNLNISGQIWLMLAPYANTASLIENYDTEIDSVKEPFVTYPEFFIGNNEKDISGEERRSHQRGAFLFMPFEYCKIPFDQVVNIELDFVCIEISKELKEEIIKIPSNKNIADILDIKQSKFTKEYMLPDSGSEMEKIVKNIRKKFGFDID